MSSSPSPAHNPSSAREGRNQKRVNSASTRRTTSRHSSTSNAASIGSHSDVSQPKWLKLTADPFVPAIITRRAITFQQDDLITTAGAPRGAARALVGQQLAVPLDWKTAQNTTFEHGFAATPLQPGTHMPKGGRNVALSKAEWLALMAKSS